MARVEGKASQKGLGATSQFHARLREHLPLQRSGTILLRGTPVEIFLPLRKELRSLPGFQIEESQVAPPYSTATLCLKSTRTHLGQAFRISLVLRARGDGLSELCAVIDVRASTNTLIASGMLAWAVAVGLGAKWLGLASGILFGTYVFGLPALLIARVYRYVAFRSHRAAQCSAIHGLAGALNERVLTSIAEAEQRKGALSVSELSEDTRGGVSETAIVGGLSTASR